MTSDPSERHGKSVPSPEILGQHYVNREAKQPFLVNTMAMTGMDVNGYNMMNDGSFLFFGTMGGIVGPRGGKMKK